jgi:hypothetical protein
MTTETTTQNITLTVPLDTVNFILATLDKNPLSAPVMQVANLINGLKQQAEFQIKAAEAAEKAAAASAPETKADGLLPKLRKAKGAGR